MEFITARSPFTCLAAQDWGLWRIGTKSLTPLCDQHVGQDPAHSKVWESWLSGKDRLQKWISCLPFPSGEKQNLDNRIQGTVTHPSFLAHNKLGPNTIAMLLGVILLMSLVWASFARNLIKYLRNKREKKSIYSEILGGAVPSCPGGAQPQIPQMLPARCYLTWSCLGLSVLFCFCYWSNLYCPTLCDPMD